MGIIKFKTIFAGAMLALLCISLFAQGNGKFHDKWEPVSGKAVHYFTSATLHSSTPTAVGKVDRSTDIIDLSGDLNGKVIYHVTSTFDFSAGTLRNRGVQVFSGTVLNSTPVLILDDQFEFRVNLFTGETRGDVYLEHTLDGLRTVCELKIIGTGFDNAGNGLADYVGRCKKNRERPFRKPNTIEP